MLLWMLSATLFAACVAMAAWCAERALRIAGRAARGAWLFALAAGTIWPVLVPLLRRLHSAPEVMTPGATVLEAVRIGSERLSAAHAWLPTLDRIALVAWIIGSSALLLRYVVLWRAVRALRRSAERVVVDGVDVLMSENLGPAVVGVRDAAVLVPRAVLQLDAPLRALVLRHEEEHRRARDTWLLLALAAAVVLVPWNVSLWWIARRARLALEVDCDARVLATCGSATRYVQVLLLAAQRTGAAPLTPMLVASRSHLERRIIAMQERTALDSQGAMRTWRVAMSTAASAIALMAAWTAPIAGQTPATRPADTTSTKPLQVREPYFEFQVEKPASFVPGTTFPVYPPELKAAKVEGEVLAQFVVDTLGRPVVSTFKVLKSDHQLFTESVKTALPDMRFTPAEVGGRKVKQLVQQPFTFAMDKATPGPVTIPSPKKP